MSANKWALSVKHVVITGEIRKTKEFNPVF